MTRRPEDCSDLSKLVLNVQVCRQLGAQLTTLAGEVPLRHSECPKADTHGIGCQKLPDKPAQDKPTG